MKKTNKQLFEEYLEKLSEAEHFIVTGIRKRKGVYHITIKDYEHFSLLGYHLKPKTINEVEYKKLKIENVDLFIDEMKIYFEYYNLY